MECRKKRKRRKTQELCNVERKKTKASYLTFPFSMASKKDHALGIVE